MVIRNRIETDQQGTGNDALINQIGDDNKAVVNQLASSTDGAVTIV